MRCVLCAALMVVLWGHTASADCDLSQMVGYTLLGVKTITGYIQDGRRVSGFEGCARDRVLVFDDNTGVRCMDTDVEHADRAKAYLFARSRSDMKLCVGSAFYVVAPAK
jgi:hypothetical protein